MSIKRKEQKERDEVELEEKVLYINRCARVVKGGRKFRFSALLIVGDGHGTVGIGFSKAHEVADAIRKSAASARKNLVSFELNGTTIPHEVLVKWDGVKILLKPAKEGTGVIAGSQVRAVLEVGGVRDVIAKSLGSNNPVNQVRAVVKALSELKGRQEALDLRGK